MSDAPPSLPEALAAVQVLSRLGLSDELVGRTVREWLARTDLGTPAADLSTPHPLSARAPMEPDSGVAVTRLAAPVDGAAKQLEVPVNLSRFEFVKVRFADGTATNVALPRDLFQMLTLAYGSPKAAREQARELAKTAPREGNRSAWVAQALRERVLAEQPGAANSAGPGD